MKIDKEWMQAAIIFLFLFPIFYQLSGSIFTAEGPFDSQGKLLLVPLPFASIFCFLGIAGFLRLEKRHFGMGFIFSMFVAMMLSAIVSTGAKGNFELSKFILLIQFLLPLFALVLGGLYVPPKSRYLKFEMMMLYVLILVLPLEIIATLIEGNVHLASHLYLFTLYQHLQYLPVIFVSFFLIAAATSGDDKNLRIPVLFAAIWMGAYISASISISAILLATIGMLVLLFSLYRSSRTKYALLLIGIVLASFTVYFSFTNQSSYDSGKLGDELRISPNRLEVFTELEESYLKQYQGTIVASLPGNLKERMIYWIYFGKGIFENPKTLFFGHINRPDRDIFPSAHNYYLDLVYNFGIVSLVPFLYLIVVTFVGIWRVAVQNRLDPNLLMLIVLVSFFVFVDNSLKVGFRQPYPGMIMFFFWGVLLTRLSDQNKNSDVVEAVSDTSPIADSRQTGL